MEAKPIIRAMKTLLSRVFPVEEKNISSFLGSFHRFLFKTFISIKNNILELSLPGSDLLPGLQVNWFARIKNIGYSAQLGDYEKRKLGIFNLLNFLQLISGILMPVIVLFNDPELGMSSMLLACTPALISAVVLWLNHKQKHEAARIFYFLFYPVFTSIVYMGGMNLGIDLYFILFGILSVFFLQEIGQMLFAVSLSMISYYMLAVVLKRYSFQLADSQYFFYLFNQALAILFIFYGLFLIKKENNGYQYFILARNEELRLRNIEIQEQQQVIAEKASLLQKQTEELVALNGLKNQLFSVIAHDLKSPMYALRNLFRNMQQQDMPASEIKQMVPDVVNDLNYTTSLMDNLLQWAKSQMQADAVKPVIMDMHPLAEEVIRMLRLQAEQKNIIVSHSIPINTMVFADADMVHLVLRNLLSNAIKFTPHGGKVSIDANLAVEFAEVFVKDTGKGMSAEDIKKIRENNFYTTSGTASESGTGLGLMLCKEFLSKNGGQLHIESDPATGSTISFTLPREN